MILLLLPYWSSAQSAFPQVEISNRLIKAKLLLPDPVSGYYRGTRFDWSGVMPELEVNGHTFFGQWFEAYDPTLHDAIMGPVEEFAPLAYSEAEAGGSFVKIGVGVLRKPVEEKYNRFNYYSIDDNGRWLIKRRPDQVSFTHKINHKEYGYRYTKSIILIPGKPVMEIVHILVNTGRRVIETNVYNHNFFVIDRKYTGPGLEVVFPFELKVDPQRRGDLADVTGNTITFKREFVVGERVNLGTLSGFGCDADDYDITIENRTTGAGVRIKGDKPLSNLVFWASLKVLSPEPYIDIRIEPGQEYKWKITYEFYSLKHNKGISVNNNGGTYNMVVVQ